MSKVSKTKEERAEDFKNLVLNFNTSITEEGFYPLPMIEEFVDYWCESNLNGKKLRFEKEKTFDIKRRLKTFWRNSVNWEKPYTKKEKKKIDQSKLRL